MPFFGLTKLIAIFMKNIVCLFGLVVSRQYRGGGEAAYVSVVIASFLIYRYKKRLIHQKINFLKFLLHLFFVRIV